MPKKKEMPHNAASIGGGYNNGSTLTIVYSTQPLL
jgi:hypothetical protein